MQRRKRIALVLLSVVFSLVFAKSKSNDETADMLDALPAALLRGAEEAYDINMHGLDALDRGDLDSAAVYFSKAQSMLPLYSDAQNNMGVVHFRRGNIAQASMIWKSLLEKDPGYAVALYNLGILLFEEKKYDDSRVQFSKAITSNKKFYEAFVMLGRAELAAGKPRDALEHFKAAAKIAPDKVETWQFLAYGYINNADTSQAQAILLKHQDNPVALKMLGQIASAKKDPKAAAAYLKNAVAKGGNADQLLELAQSQLDAHACKDALGTLEQYASSVSNQSADYFLYSGIAFKECGETKSARSAFEKGLSKYPSDQIIRYNLGQIYFMQKQFDLAESMWTTVADSLDDPSLSYLRGLNAHHKGDLALAETYVRKALKRDEQPQYFDLLGTILFAKGKKDEAAQNFKKALKLDPDYRSAQLNLALISQSKDDLERAAMEMEKSVSECRSNCQDQILQLSVLYYHLSEIDKAAALLGKIPDNEKNEKIVRHLALYYRDLHDWEKAIAVLEKAKTRFVSDAQTDCELAEDYLLSGNNQKAIEALTALLQKWDQNPWRIYYQLGYACMEMKEFEKAKNYLQQSLKKKPDNLATQGLLAYIFNAQGDVAQARSIWEKTLHDDPNNATLLINMGLSLEKDGHYEAALEYYQKALLLKTGDNGIQINIGNAYCGLDKNYEALKAYELALNSSKRNLAAYNIFVLSQKSNTQAESAEMLSILTSEFPSSVYTKRAQADMSLMQKDTATALAKLESLTDKDGADYLTMARIYAMKKNFSKATQCLGKVPSDALYEKEKIAIQAQMDFLNGNFSEAFQTYKTMQDTSFATQYNMAVSAYNGKNYSDACAIAEKIIGKAKSGDRAEVLKLAGNAAIGLKQWKKAQQFYLQLDDLRIGNDALTQYNLAVICYNLNMVDESYSYYQKAKRLDPTISSKDIEKRYESAHGQTASSPTTLDNVDALYNDAVALQSDGKDTAAEIAYKNLLEKSPSYYHAWNNLGAIYSARGELDQAVQCYLKSIEKQHDIPEAYANLVNVYVAIGNFKEAQRWIVKGRGHNPDSDMLKDLDAKVKEMAKRKK